MLIQIAFQGVVAARLVICELHAYAELVLATWADRHHPAEEAKLVLVLGHVGQNDPDPDQYLMGGFGLGAMGGDPLHSGSVAEYLQARQGNVSRDGRDAAAILADYPDRVLGLDAVERSFFF